LLSRCWEVDILPGRVIADMLDRDIHGWFNYYLWQQREREIERARALL